MKLRMLLPLVLAINPQIPQAFSTSSTPGVSVEFSLVPACGGGSDSQGNIGGKVIGLEYPDHYKVIIYAHTDWWYVQPLGDSPYTDIGSNGNWNNWTHLGQRYAALVVKDSFIPSARIQNLPKVDGNVIAKGDVPCHA